MINIFPGTGLYNIACKTGVIKDKVAFLKDGCPLINISQLTNAEYSQLSSFVYETNMRAKLVPENFDVICSSGDPIAVVNMACNKCRKEISFRSDAMHIQKVFCPFCMQRHYVDPFLKIEIPDGSFNILSNNTSIALWGAGEICIKLLDRLDKEQFNNVKVIDASKSRQGCTICGKIIQQPDIIHSDNIDSIIVAVITRKHEVIGELMRNYPQIRNIYLPEVSAANNELIFGISNAFVF
jgi:hypothetical protein